MPGDETLFSDRPPPRSENWQAYKILEHCRGYSTARTKNATASYTCYGNLCNIPIYISRES